MKILKEGNLLLYRGICSICGCIVDFERQEGNLNYLNNELTARCPTKECGNFITAYPIENNENLIENIETPTGGYLLTSNKS